MLHFIDLAIVNNNFPVQKNKTHPDTLQSIWML